MASLRASWKSSEILKKVENLAKHARFAQHENRPATRGGSRMAPRHSALCSPREPCWTCKPRGGPGSSFSEAKTGNVALFGILFLALFCVWKQRRLASHE